MPQPLKGRESDQAAEGTQILRDRMHCAAMIGLVAAEWVNIEEQMAYTFAIATSDIHLGPNLSVTYVNHPVAIATMLSLDSLSARLDVMRNSISRMIPALEKEFDQLAVRIRRCAKPRNTVVHGRWAISEQYPQDVLLVVQETADTTYIRYTIKDFEDILSRMNEQLGDILAFHDKCENARVTEARRKAAQSPS